MAIPIERRSRFTMESFAFIAALVDDPVTISVHSQSPHRSMADLVAALRAQPGRITYGTAGIGAVGHIAFLTLARALGVTAEHVPFQGAAQTLTAFSGGHIDLYGGSIAVAMPAIRDGRARCLMLTQRAQHPEVPTASGLDALGVPNEETLIWWGMLAPRGMPADRRAALMAAFEAAWRTERFQTQLARSGVTQVFRNSAASAALITEENEALARVVRQIGIERQR
jgi:tripartite-type tricarboxylate transporter receptor subunit TctC